MNDHAETAREILAGALEISTSSIPTDASIDNLAAWDSIAHMKLIMVIEERLQRALEPQEVADVFSLEDVARLLGR